MYANTIIFMALAGAMALLAVILTSRRVLSLGSGLFWLCFWAAMAGMAYRRDVLKTIMASLMMVDFTNFLLLCSSTVILILLFVLFINLKRQSKRVDRLIQEMALLEFELNLNRESYQK